MPRIKNMGQASAKFNEGVIISGSAGTDTHTLVITGSTYINGDVTCNNINIGADSSGAGKTISAGNTDTRIEFSHLDKVKFFVGGVNMFECDENASQDVVTINQGGNDVDFRIETDNKQYVVYTDAAFDLLVLGSDQAMPPGLGSDTNIYVSGSLSGEGRTVFGGEVVVSGSLYAKQRHVTTNKYNASDASQQYVRFDAAGSNGTPGVNNKFLVPAPGRLIKVFVRATTAGGNTSVGFHRASDGDATLNTTAIETREIDIAASNTSYVAKFPETSDFMTGDIVGISINPTNNPNDVNITCIWEFDFVE